MNKPLETYTDEAHRNRRKISRRRDDLNAIAQAAGWDSWSQYETAVRQGKVKILPNET